MTEPKRPLHLWVDADAAPKVIKEIMFRAAERAQLPMTLVANQYIAVPPSQLIKSVQVSAGFDVADNHIVEHCEAGDLVITADIPLASQVVEKGAFALNPRGEFYTKENIAQRLTMRNLMEELRSAGMVSGGPPPLNQNDRKVFANALDRFLAKHVKN